MGQSGDYFGSHFFSPPHLTKNDYGTYFFFLTILLLLQVGEPAGVTALQTCLKDGFGGGDVRSMAKASVALRFFVAVDVLGTFLLPVVLSVLVHFVARCCR